MRRWQGAVILLALGAGCGGVSAAEMEQRVELTYRDSGIAGASDATARCEDLDGKRFRCDVEVIDAAGETICTDSIEAEPEDGDNYAELSTRDGCG